MGVCALVHVSVILLYIGRACVCVCVLTPRCDRRGRVTAPIDSLNLLLITLWLDAKDLVFM